MLSESHPAIRTRLLSRRRARCGCGAVDGRAHSGIVTACGALWTWGMGHFGRLGHNDEQDRDVPMRLEGQLGGRRAGAMAAGSAKTMMLTSCGALWGCGRGLGLGCRLVTPRCVWWRAAAHTPWR